ncbi:MAG TPA: hypothetical protein DCM67_05090 [Propionibacteriaceae bacterium]|nr:hypothetical protein [Propionibacteriaceae bacterium]
MSPMPSFHALTTTAPGRANRITTHVQLGAPFDPQHPPNPMPPLLDVGALWDTGSTHSVVTPSTVLALNIPPTGVVTMSHAGGTRVAKTFVVSIMLPNQVGIAAVQVSECAEDVGQFGAIIGMDIITMGDFAITNAQGKTCMTFRIPSVETIDFVKQANSLVYAGVGRNDPCPCGSGQKFKKCHGK